ncbi:ABC transporter ATP-binding protein [Carnobacteriaceae bacterium zg-ZUI78]|nr:ABC transporter ATP-binding protein [Carnobacteriaceae bacterium zg-ZUI78]
MLVLENIDVSVGKKENRQHVLKGASFSVQKGQIVTIVGKSGSGKSTLLKTIMGMLDIDNGDIIFHNQYLSRLPLKQRRTYAHQHMSFIWQDFKLVEEMTVKDNILLPLVIHKKKIDTTFFHHVVKTIGIEHLLNKYPHTISGGEQQRCAIARSIMYKPKLILADEPTGALDSQTSNDIVTLFYQSLKQFADMVIIVTHDKDLARIGDKKLMLIDGKVVDL